MNVIPEKLNEMKVFILQHFKQLHSMRNILPALQVPISFSPLVPCRALIHTPCPKSLMSLAGERKTNVNRK